MAVENESPSIMVINFSQGSRFNREFMAQLRDGLNERLDWRYFIASKPASISWDEETATCETKRPVGEDEFILDRVGIVIAVHPHSKESSEMGSFGFLNLAFTFDVHTPLSKQFRRFDRFVVEHGTVLVDLRAARLDTPEGFDAVRRAETKARRSAALATVILIGLLIAIAWGITWATDTERLFPYACASILLVLAIFLYLNFEGPGDGINRPSPGPQTPLPDVDESPKLSRA